MRCFKDDVKGPPLEGVYVHGLVLDSAAWDTRASRIIDAKQQVLVAVTVSCSLPTTLSLHKLSQYSRLPPAILFHRCSLDLSSLFRRLISEVDWPIVTKLFHMFDGDPDL